jgi:hypothetical protein
MSRWKQRPTSIQFLSRQGGTKSRGDAKRCSKLNVNLKEESMPIEIDVRIIGESTQQVVQELGAFASHLSGGFGVGPHKPDTTAPIEISGPNVETLTGNGADKPATTSRKRAAAKSDHPAPEAPRIDRAAIIDGLTKIYSKGDEDVRLAITKFRDGQGADRLRDLKDDALPAAAELLTELKLAAEQPAV